MSIHWRKALTLSFGFLVDDSCSGHKDLYVEANGRDQPNVNSLKKIVQKKNVTRDRKPDQQNTF